MGREVNLDMKPKDKLLIKHGNDLVMELYYLTSIQTKHFFCKEEDIVGKGQQGIIWINEDYGSSAFIPIKKKHSFIQIDQTTWELDVEPIDIGDL